MKYFESDLSGAKFPENQKISLMLIKSNILDFIKKDYPKIEEHSHISLSELINYQQKYIEYFLKSEFEDLSLLEKDVIEKVKSKDFISSNFDDDYDSKLSFGQRVADKVAEFGGSWKFIISFITFIIFWIIINTYAVFSKDFDPYPFILLNLFLSCIAAIQAPIIIMSQNRHDERDRERSKEDYKINLKAEMEIRIMQEKLDHLILVQQQRMFEIQNIQVDMLKNITYDISGVSKKI